MAITTVMPEATLSDVESRPQERSAARLDEDAFRAFYERTARQLWAYLSRIADDPGAADELLQEAYFRIYKAGDGYESESHRRNALFRIATNLVRDRHRRARGHTSVDLEHAEGGDIDAATRAAERIDVRDALRRLGPQQRQLLWLAYAQGLSHEEIAGITGASRKSIKSMLYRARQRLAALLRRNGDRDA